MSKHTPGPWTKEGGMVLDSRRNIVASRWSWRHVDKDENSLRSDEAIHPAEADANCHLLAAAPDLLAAVKAILEETQDNPLGFKDALSCHEIRGLAQAAIAKCSPS